MSSRFFHTICKISCLSSTANRTPLCTTTRRAALAHLLTAISLSAVCVAQQVGPGAQENSEQRLEKELEPPESRGSPVQIDGRPILMVQAPIGGVSPEERAVSIQNRILNLARMKSIPVDVIHAEDRLAWSEVLAGKDLLMAVTEADAKASDRPRNLLAAEYAEIFRRTVTSYRQEHTWRAILVGLLKMTVATLGLVLAVLLLLRLRRGIRKRLDSWLVQTDSGPTHSVRSRAARYLVLPLLGTGVVIVLLGAMALLEVYVVFVLSSFPSTRYTAIRMNRWTASSLSTLAHNVWNYLPDLIILMLIVFASRYLIRLNNFVFAELQAGRIVLPGFYPDWGAPTAKLVRVLILAATAIVMFPYLPGSESPAFRGITVFLGVLLSLGSTSAVSHGVAGTILTYMRSFNVGDFVRIGDTVGEVVEKNLLVTRICTQKCEIVTIPNGSVLGGVVTNYTSEACKKGVVFHTTVSIGYNAPWKTVHDLLIQAARATSDILPDPSPFVLQAKLDDFYVCYELNAFTAKPQGMQFIYSELHQNIQDRFNEAGIEINSPHFLSLRDGNRIAIPQPYISNSYQEPAFRVQEITNANGASRARTGKIASSATGSGKI